MELSFVRNATTKPRFTQSALLKKLKMNVFTSGSLETELLPNKIKKGTTRNNLCNSIIMSYTFGGALFLQ